MSDANKAVARRAWDAYCRGDVARFSACLTDDWIEYDTDGSTANLQDNVEIMDIHRSAFPDKRAEILHDVAEGDLVAQHIIITGTQTGAYFGLEPTGKPVRTLEMMVHRFRDGRIAESWAITAGGGFYEQLTGHPAPDTNENLG